MIAHRSIPITLCIVLISACSYISDSSGTEESGPSHRMLAASRELREIISQFPDGFVEQQFLQEDCNFNGPPEVFFDFNSGGEVPSYKEIEAAALDSGWSLNEKKALEQTIAGASFVLSISSPSTLEGNARIAAHLNVNGPC